MISSPAIQGKVEGLNKKDVILCIHPYQNILRIQRGGMIMEPLKKVIHFLKLPIIQLFKEPRIPTTTIPNINHPSILRETYRKKNPRKLPSTTKLFFPSIYIKGFWMQEIMK